MIIKLEQCLDKFQKYSLLESQKVFKSAGKVFKSETFVKLVILSMNICFEPSEREESHHIVL